MHAIGLCLAVLLFRHFIVMLLFLLNEINGDGDGARPAGVERVGSGGKFSGP